MQCNASPGEGGGKGLPEIEREYIEWRKTRLNETGDAWEAFKAAWERSRTKGAVGSLDALREDARSLGNLVDFLGEKKGEIEELCVNPGRLWETVEAAARIALALGAGEEYGALLERSSVSGANRPESSNSSLPETSKLGNPERPARPLDALEVKAYIISREVRRLPNPYSPAITLARYEQREGPDKWAVQMGSNVLNKDGEWEYEPKPSSRDDAYLARCRFDTPEEAYTAYLKAGANGQEEG